MKLIRHTEEQPSNIVQFECSMEMTKFDIKNYLEKIYNVRCATIRTRIRAPKTKRDVVHGYVVKEDDVKYAYITLVSINLFVVVNMFLTSSHCLVFYLNKIFSQIYFLKMPEIYFFKDIRTCF